MTYQQKIKDILSHYDGDICYIIEHYPIMSEIAQMAYEMIASGKNIKITDHSCKRLSDKISKHIDLFS